MPTGPQAIVDLAQGTGVSRTVVVNTSRFIRDGAGQDFWPLGSRGGGINQPHVTAAHLVSLFLGISFASPLTAAAETVVQVRNLQCGASSYLPPLKDGSGLGSAFTIRGLHPSPDGLSAGPFCLSSNLGDCLDQLVAAYDSYRQSEFYPGYSIAETVGDLPPFEDSRIRVTLQASNGLFVAAVRISIEEEGKARLLTGFYGSPGPSGMGVTGGDLQPPFPAPLPHVVDLYEPHFAMLSAILESTEDRDRRRLPPKEPPTKSEGAARPRATPSNRLVSQDAATTSRKSGSSPNTPKPSRAINTPEATGMGELAQGRVATPSKRPVVASRPAGPPR